MSTMNSMMRVLVISGLAMLTNCDKSNSGDGEQEFRFYRSITVDGRMRTYLINLPPDYYEDLSARALVIGLHGTGGSATQFEMDYRFSEKANVSGFIAVYPEGVQRDGVFRLRTWNAGTCCDYAMQNNVDDVKFISELMDLMITGYHIDPGKVYVTGMSNGGMMAYRLACEIPHKIAAIAVVSGTMMKEDACSPSRAVPVLHIHSERDSKVPAAGGTGLGGYHYPAVDSVLTVWSSLNSCTEAPVRETDNGYTLTKWSGCKDDVAIEYYLTSDGGHAWPGSMKVRVNADDPSAMINANDVLWNFFQRYELP